MIEITHVVVLQDDLIVFNIIKKKIRGNTNVLKKQKINLRLN
jgi:hypothetical protein